MTGYKIELIRHVEAAPVNGMYTDPQGVMVHLSQIRRAVEALTAEIGKINRGNNVKVAIDPHREGLVRAVTVTVSSQA